MGDLVGKVLGPYKLEEQLGRGGMATVYRAYQTTVKRYVAVKVMSSEIASDPGFVERFTREAELIAALQHPHILPVIDYGESEGTHYLVMRYIDGGSLDDRMRKKPLTLDDASRYLEQIASALDYAHKRGVIHRDFKPNNVLLDGEDNAYLTDFGIARLMNNESRLTVTGTVMGTPAYMSPEQGMGKTVDARSDLYSLGVVLYEMVVGRLPFSGDTPASLIFQHAFQPPAPPQQFKPELAPGVASVISRALAKEPDDRYQSGMELSRAFDEATGRRASTPSQGSRPAITPVDLNQQTFVDSVPTSGTPRVPTSRMDDRTVPPTSANPAQGAPATIPPNVPPTIPPSAPASAYSTPAPTPMPTPVVAKPTRSPLPLIIGIAAALALIIGIGGGIAIINGNNQKATSDSQTQVAMLALSATKTPTSTPTATETVTNTPSPTATATANLTETSVSLRLTALAQIEANGTATAVALINATATMQANLAETTIANITKTANAIQTGTAAVQATQTAAVAASQTAAAVANANNATKTAVANITSTARAKATSTPPPTKKVSPTATPNLNTGNGGDYSSGTPDEVVDKLRTDGIVKAQTGSVAIEPTSESVKKVTQPNYYQWISLNTTEYKDFVVSSNFTWTGQGSDGECGFLVRYTQPTDTTYRFYTFTVSAAEIYRVITYKDSTDTVTKKGPVSKVDTSEDATNHILLVAQGKDFLFYVNSTLVTKITLDGFASGKVAVLATTLSDTGIVCSFDNVWVYELGNGNTTDPNSLPNLTSNNAADILNTLADAGVIDSASDAELKQTDPNNSIVADKDKFNVFYRKTISDTVYTNFIMSTNVQWDYSAKTTACGIHFYGSKNPDNLLTFYFFPDQTYAIDSYLDGKWTDKPIEKDTNDAIKTEKSATNRITAIVKDGTAIFYVNGQRVASAENLPLSKGALGYYLDKGKTGGAESCSFSRTMVWTLK